MPVLGDLIRKAKMEPQAKEPANSQPAPAESGEDRALIDSYGEARIYKARGEPLLLYEVPVPRYRGEEKELIDSILDVAARVINVDEALFETKDDARDRYIARVLEIIDAYPELKIPANSKEFYAKAVVREMVGFGLLDPLVSDDELEEIMVIGTGKPVYVFRRKYEMMKTNIVFYEDKDVIELIDRIARNIGRRIDLQSPLLDARLPNGTRVNATIPPVSLNGATITLRKFRTDPISIIDLINNNTMSYEVAAFLWLISEGMGAMPANLIIAGGTASGKTTLLNSITSFVPNYERLVSIEDIAEIRLPFDHWVRFEVRPPGVEGTGEIDANTLLKNALRMRPDRIIIGEIRGEEAYTLFSAMNTGHKGVCGTLHSNTARETISRLTSPPMSVPTIMLSALNFIIMQQRVYDRRKGLIRRISEIAELVPSEPGALPSMQVLYEWDPVKDEIVPTGAQSNYVQMLAKYAGGTRDSVMAELEARTQVLRELNAKGIRELSEVCRVTQNYALKKQGKA